MATTAAIATAKTVILPATATKGTDIAIVWIHGASCDNTAYQSIAQEVQKQGGKNKQKIWVAIPGFLTGTPDPVTISHEINSAIDEL